MRSHHHPPGRAPARLRRTRRRGCRLLARRLRSTAARVLEVEVAYARGARPAPTARSLQGRRDRPFQARPRVHRWRRRRVGRVRSGSSQLRLERAQPATAPVSRGDTYSSFVRQRRPTSPTLASKSAHAWYRNARAPTSRARRVSRQTETDYAPRPGPRRDAQTGPTEAGRGASRGGVRGTPNRAQRCRIDRNLLERRPHS